MAYETDPSVSPDDNVRAENALMKLKLELNHGMKYNDTSGLEPETEREWLQHILEFEKQYEQKKRVKIYDFLGQPYFVRLEGLEKDQVKGALDQLISIMEQGGISLQCCAEYEPSVIYRFITEELFEEETDDVHVKGMVHCFIYEDFYPNHEHEIRCRASDFIEQVLTRKWIADFDSFYLSEELTFLGGRYRREEISSIIQAFQDAHASFGEINFRIEEVTFNPETGEGALKGLLSFNGTLERGIAQPICGNCTIDFVYDINLWLISGFSLPGLG